jgi:fatty acid desaturase
MTASVSRRYPIPVFLNLATLSICSALYFGLLFAASRAPTLAGVIGYGVLFAAIMIPVYSLIHEAAHNMLVPDSRWNDRLGRWLCMLFIVSFSFFKHCHLRHHRKNRTDIECWDLCLERHTRWKRYGNLYLMMAGLGYLSLWLSVVLFAIAPRLVYSRVFQKHTEIAGFLEGSDEPGKLARFRVESWAVLLFQAAVFWVLDLRFVAWLVPFLIHGFIWSSQNYVNHAFSRRDVLNGAHNLKIPRWLKPLYLNFNLHLAHHQNPYVPWRHLPQFVEPNPQRISFFLNYLRLWTGPRLSLERDPAAAD